MLTVTDNWKSAVQRADPKLRVLVEIYDGTNTWKAVSGSMDSTSDLVGTPAAVLGVTPLGSELELIRAKTEFNETHVTVTDAWARPIVVNNRLKGQRMHIYLGAAELDEVDFAAFAKHTMIEEIEPQDGKTVRFVCVSQSRFLADAKAQFGYWVHKHPLEVLYLGDGTGVLELAGCHTIDTTAFDRTQTKYDAIDHLLIGRVDFTGKNAEKKKYWPETKIFEADSSALAIAEDVCTLIGANLVETEDGEMSLVYFDDTDTAVDHWDQSTILPGSIEQLELDSNMVNSILIHYGLEGDEDKRRKYSARDTVSGGRYAYPGQASRRVVEEFSFNWSGATYQIASDIDASQTSFSISGYPYGAWLTGNRSGFTVDATHPVYIMLDSTLRGGSQELVKCTGMTPDTTKNYSMNVWTGTDWVKVTGSWSAQVTFTGCTRGFRNTTAQAHDATYSNVDGIYKYSRAYDVTPFVLLADTILDRFANGCPIISCKTPMYKFRLQLGDTVTLDDDNFLGYGFDGLDSGTKWQIIGKEADPLASPPAITWKLAMSATDAGAKTVEPQSQWTNADILKYIASAGDATQFAVREGLGITDAGGLDVTIAAGTCSNGVTSSRLTESMTITLPASRDVYIYFAVNTPATPVVVFNDLVIGSPAPDTPGDHVILGIVETGAASITSIDTTGKPTATVIGSVVIPGTVDTDQLADAAIVATKLDIDSVDSTHLTDGCVVPDTIATDAVTNTKIADNAVDTPQIANNAIEAPKIKDDQIGTIHTKKSSWSRNHNGDFNMWTREP